MGVTIAAIAERLRERVPVRLPLPPGARRAAVLLLLSEGPAGVEVLLTERSDDVQVHKGQVSLPGGMAEPDDRDEVATALREASEEVGLDPGAVRVVGQLDDYHTITRFLVTPIVALVPSFAGLGPASPEVASVFAFPLSWLVEPSHLESIPWERHGRIENVLSTTYDNHVIWGATARILTNLMEAIA
jgi:8-oxo-dGTP pyrophosphatase MutT (NUDIX family)